MREGERGEREEGREGGWVRGTEDQRGTRLTGQHGGENKAVSE